MAYYNQFAPEVIFFDPSAYTPRPLETVVENVTLSNIVVSPNLPYPDATVTMTHDGTRFLSITVENGLTRFTLEGADLEYERGLSKHNFYHSYNGFLYNPTGRYGVTPGVPGSGYTLGWGAGITKRRFIPEWYHRPLGDDTVMDMMIHWRMEERAPDNPFDHLAGSVRLSMGKNRPYVTTEQLAMFEPPFDNMSMVELP